MPAAISPITRGWPSLRKTAPPRWASATTTVMDSSRGVAGTLSSRPGSSEGTGTGPVAVPGSSPSISSASTEGSTIARPYATVSIHQATRSSTA